MYAYFGHHKCATRWIRGILGRIAAENGWQSKEVNMAELDTQNALPALADNIRNKKDFLLISQASVYKAVPELPGLKGLHVFRDPRDILVSGYYSHLKVHRTNNWPSLREFRNKLQSISKEAGLIEEIKFSRFTYVPLQEWQTNNPNIYELKMEELTARPYYYFRQVFEFWGVFQETTNGSLANTEKDINGEAVAQTPQRVTAYWNRALNRAVRRNKLTLANQLKLPYRKVTAGQLKRVLEMHRFEKLAKGRKKGQEDTSSHYRKGKAGDWQNHFTPPVKEAFKQAYGDLLIKFGYENDHNW